MSADRQRGLALLEVLVSLAIAGLATAMLFSGAMDGLRGSKAAGRTQEALSHARSHLAALGHGRPLVAGETTTDDGGGFAVRLAVRPVASLMPETNATLYAVRVTVGWQVDGRDRQLALETMRVGAGR
jgi:general secretion pathway protein I